MSATVFPIALVALVALGVLGQGMSDAGVTQQPPVLCVKQDDCPANEVAALSNFPAALSRSPEHNLKQTFL